MMKKFLLFTVILFSYLAVAETIFSFIGVKITSNNFERHLSKFIPKNEWEDCRAFLHDLQDADPRIHTVKGSVLKLYKPFKSKTYNVNKYGFRGKEITPKKKDELRIIIAGASVIWGNIAGDDKTIPSIIEQILKKKYPQKNITVYNLGIETNEFPRIMETIKFATPLINPDYTVIFFGGIHAWYAYLDEPMDLSIFKDTKPLYAVSEKNTLYNKIGVFIRKFSLGSLIWNQLDSISWAEDTFNIVALKEKKLNQKRGRKERIESFAKSLSTMMQEMSTFSKNNNMKISYFFQPILSQKKCQTDNEKIVGDYFFNNLYVGFDSFYDACTVKLNTMSKNHKINAFYDLTQVFENNCDDIFWDSGHVTTKGYKILAEAMSKVLIEEIIDEDEK